VLDLDNQELAARANFVETIFSNTGVALIDKQSNAFVSYNELEEKVIRFSKQIEPGRLYALTVENTADSISIYLACLLRGATLILLPEGIQESRAIELSMRFCASSIINKSIFKQLNYDDSNGRSLEGSPSRNALLMGTSGSTASPKFVRISPSNLMVNAIDIADKLILEAREIAITTLPWNYSYGLSILNSHLITGNTVVLSNHSIRELEFWRALSDYKVTNFGAVPSQYLILNRMTDELKSLPSLRYLTQAGGSLSKVIKVNIHRELSKASKQFFVMYGQTEATARISILGHEDFEKRPDSVGRCVGRGSMTTVDGELKLRSKSVCLGYAETYHDLYKDDENSGILSTGDIGSVDNEGYIFVFGRKKREIKVGGRRINLDYVEDSLRSASLNCAVVSFEDTIFVYYQDQENRFNHLLDSLLEEFLLNRRQIRFKKVQELPMLHNGKIDYKLLEDDAF